MKLKPLCAEKVKILHVVGDDKFIDIGIRRFEAVFPEGNEYICITNKKNLEIIKSNKVQVVSRNVVFSIDFWKYLRSFKAVIFHSFTGYILYCIALMASKDTNLLWIGWGYDYYPIITGGKGLLKEKTLLIYNRLHKAERKSFFANVKSAIRKIVELLVKKPALRRINYFAPVIYEDYELVREKAPWMKAEFLPWNYTSTESPFDDLRVTGNDILIGNSATHTNNHIEVFQLLSGFDLTGRKIYCPLSYGNKKYGEYIIAKGREYFGDAFIPLTDFLPLEDYKNILSRCSLVFMNHLRQQGAGNISIALACGAKVFLDPANPLFWHYENKGVRIFSINDLDDEKFSPLANGEMEMNRKIVLGERLTERVNQKTRNVIDKLLDC